MSTRSYIGSLQADGSVRYIYCHFDGYVEGVGATLAEHWTDPAKVAALLDLGSLSVLGTEIGKPQNFSGPRHEGWCLAYGRDRGDVDDVAPQTAPHPHSYFLASLHSLVEWVYLFQGGVWYVTPAARARQVEAQWARVTDGTPLVAAPAAPAVPRLQASQATMWT